MKLELILAIIKDFMDFKERKLLWKQVCLGFYRLPRLIYLGWD